MATTTHIGMTLVEQSQSQKEVTVNQALTRIDALMNTGAKSRTINTPPGSPASGDVYIIAASPTGAWAGQAGKIGYFDQTWKFITPNEGAAFWVNDENILYVFDGASWVTVGGTVRKTLWIPASQMRPSVTNGCSALAQLEIAAGQPDVLTLGFDAATEQYAQFPVAFRKGWDEGTVTAVLYWSHPATATNFDVVWGVQGVAISNDDAMGVAFGTAQTVTDSGGTTNDIYTTPETSAITITGTPADADVCFFRVYRKAADAADNLAVSARLHGIKLFYTVNSYWD
ncbi:MAG: DUF2793 domain-containing protein [Alphaproteobacteria bacterium]